MKITYQGEIREFADGMNALDMAGEIDKELKKAALAARVNGEVAELVKPVPDGATVEFLSGGDADGLRVLRHTASHVLAQAVKAVSAVRNQPPMTVMTPETRYTALSRSHAPSAKEDPMATMKVT